MLKLKNIIDGKGGNHLLPFLWMHGEDEPTLRTMMRKIHECGIGEVCLESRPHPDYVGEKWWIDVDVILDEAKKLGMKIWILDDSHFPTGYANGVLPAKDESLAKQYLFFHSADVVGPLPGATLDVATLAKHRPSPFEGQNPFTRGQPQKTFDDDALYAVTAYPVLEMNLLGEPVVLTDRVADGELQWDVPAGAWRVFVTYLTRNGGGNTNYINLLHAESVDVLIDEVYEKHWARYKDEFGKTILGFFSDEPAVGNVSGFNFDERIGHKDMPLPWAPEMPGLVGPDFAREVGYLWRDGADEPKTAAVRLKYMDACTKLISKNFSDRLGQWCEAHGVEYIGHIIEDNNQHTRLGSSIGHFFRGMSGMHMAGIDDIGGQVIPGQENVYRPHFLSRYGDGEFYHFALAKLGASLAQSDPKKKGRTMCEIFGAYGWNEGVREMKWLADHFIVRGVNNYVPHAFTGKEFPDPDCPPHYYAHGHNPQFRHFGQLCRYMNRLTDLFSDGKPVVNVGILYHGESYWMGEAMPGQKPARRLTENQVDFLFWPSDQIEEMPFAKLVIGECDHVTPAVADWVKRNPDKVVFVGGLPQEVESGSCYLLDELGEALKPYAAVKLEGGTKDLRVYRYRHEQDAIMFFNESVSASVDAWVDIEGDKAAIYDAWNNKLVKAEIVGGKAHIALAPNESTVLILGETAEEAPIAAGDTLPVALERKGFATAEEYPNFGELKTDLKHFSGTIAYEGVVNAPRAGRARLVIDDCNEAAELWVNGEPAGMTIAPPYRIETALRSGENHVRLEITNTLGHQQNAYDGGYFSGPTFVPAQGIFGEVKFELE